MTPSPSTRGTKNFRTLALAALVLLGGCSTFGLSSEARYENKEKEELYKNGSIASDSGGFDLFGGRSKSAENAGIGVNGYLWRAALDTVSFMPLASADPFGGVIMTDWYAAPSTPDERAKLNIFILDRELRADSVRVTVFRQTKGADGAWTDAAATPSTASALEETILTRARQMKLAKRDGK